MAGLLIGSSPLIKRTERCISGTEGRMDVDHSRTQGFMSHKCLYGHKICAVLIKMTAESMTEGMAGDPFGPAEFFFMVMDTTGNKKGADRD